MSRQASRKVTEKERERGEQMALFADAEKTLNLSPLGMAEAMAIPYDSYKDLKSGRRSIRDIHRRVIELLTAIENGGVRAAKAVIRQIRSDKPPRAWG